MPTATNPILLIDTHFWIWLVFEDVAKAGASALQRMAMAADNRQLMISVISVWEIGLLVSKNRLTLHEPCGQWMNKALSMPGLQLAPLSPEIAIDSCFLPGNFHGDPADRMIVATARRLGARLLTRDRNILHYAHQGHLALVDA